jgi:hypothetical protein
MWQASLKTLSGCWCKKTDFRVFKNSDIFYPVFILVHIVLFGDMWLNIPMPIHIINCFTCNARWPSKFSEIPPVLIARVCPA